jgi:hypothetical protein
MSDRISYQCSECGKIKSRDESIGGPSSGGWPQCCGKHMRRLENDDIGYPIVHSSLRR